MLHRIRLDIQTDSTMKLGGNGNPVEADETFIGGKARNMHKSKKARMDKMVWGNKTIAAECLSVMARLRLRSFLTALLHRFTLLSGNMFHPASNLNTDDFFGYWGSHKDSFTRSSTMPKHT